MFDHADNREENKQVGNRYLGYYKDGIFNKAPKADTGGYPTGNPPYQQYRSGPISPIDHMHKPAHTRRNQEQNINEHFFIDNPEDHFIRDVNQGMTNEYRTGFVDEDASTTRNRYSDVKQKDVTTAVFSGSTTNVNPYNDPEVSDILKSGTYSRYLEEKVPLTQGAGTYAKPPISPLQPFTRMNDINNPHAATEAIFNSYNRTKLPVADIEWRKGFRHIFITRPECYLMYNDPKTGVMGLCDQAFYDEDFNSAATRMPHIIKLLSPYYVSGSFPRKPINTNWNFLLSNRIQGLSVAPTTMTINENISKSIEGFTVTPAMHVESRQGSSIDLNFRDTKNLEVFETLRLWMLYMYKRKKGVFSPPYNGYAKTNGFIENVTEKGLYMADNVKYLRYHPYDRALEYCASLYDIITNETGTKILYWCKYYGIYPTSVSPALNNENNAAITDMMTSATFKYHYRLENVNKTLVEFNHDAGLVDNVGRISTEFVTNSLPFLLRDQYDNPVLKQYSGASGMFTGSPYIVMALSHPDPLNKSNIVSVPNLRFMNITDPRIDGLTNLGLTNTHIDQETNNIIGYV